MRLAKSDLSWREFLTYLQGLMAADSRIARRFMNSEQPSAAAEFNPEV